MTIDMIISKMQEYFVEFGNNKSDDYVYGFMDAIGAVRDLAIKMPE